MYKFNSLDAANARKEYDAEHGSGEFDKLSTRKKNMLSENQYHSRMYCSLADAIMGKDSKK